jgi:hypothetical protein
MIHQTDLAPQRRASDPTPYPHISIMFGCLACCFAFGVTFVSLGWGMP